MTTARLLCPVVLLLACACDRRDPAPASTASSAVPATGAVFKVIADDKGYTPSSVNVKKGEPVTIEFTRTSDSTCAREVVFPDLNIKKDLPLNTKVAVIVPADSARKYTFQCGMAMYKGSVVVQ